MPHDFWDGDTFVGISSQCPLQEMSALWSHMVRLLEVCCHYSWEHLLQSDKVVASVIAPLSKRKHTCVKIKFIWRIDSFLHSRVMLGGV